MTVRTYLVERKTRDHVEVTVCETAADAFGGWEEAAIEKATDIGTDGWEVDETECNAAFDLADFPK